MFVITENIMKRPVLLRMKRIEYWIRRCDVNGTGLLLMQEDTD